MKKYLKELIILALQILLFYVFPLVTKPESIMFTFFLMIYATIILSLILGIISSNKIKFIYPVVTAIIFIPTIFIYYNSSASIHILFYFIVSLIGLLLGSLFRFLTIFIVNKSLKK